MPKNPDKPKGLKNSSITRVRPVFQELFKLDTTGASWFTKLLDLVEADKKLGISLSSIKLDPALFDTRLYKDRILKQFKFESIQLENCFEYSTPPPERFLEWMIQNFDKLSVTDDKLKDSSSKTKEMRAKLFDVKDISKHAEAQKIAIEELSVKHNKGSSRKWWAFEGFTEVDCYLETDDLVLLIEGKRTEPLSSSTMWYPQRNQIVRNLEVAQEIGKAKNKEYGVLLLSEYPVEFDFETDIKSGLPHFSDSEREDIKKHYFGNFLWKDIWALTGKADNKMPDTTLDVVNVLKT